MFLLWTGYLDYKKLNTSLPVGESNRGFAHDRRDTHHYTNEDLEYFGLNLNFEGHFFYFSSMDT